jgi:hypothetical protein
MADQQSRGGQKAGQQVPEHPDQHRGTATGGEGKRSDKEKQEDQRTNPDAKKRGHLGQDHG